MTNRYIKKFFERKEIEEAHCPLTNELIMGGYKQKSDGYIEYAKEKGVENPTQYWHLIESWSNNRQLDAPFDRRIQCGELIFWMAEVSKAVDFQTLTELKEEILGTYLNNRRRGNRKIQDVCYDKIVNTVIEYCNGKKTDKY